MIRASTGLGCGQAGGGAYHVPVGRLSSGTMRPVESAVKPPRRITKARRNCWDMRALALLLRWSPPQQSPRDFDYRARS